MAAVHRLRDAGALSGLRAQSQPWLAGHTARASEELVKRVGRFARRELLRGWARKAEGAEWRRHEQRAWWAALGGSARREALRALHPDAARGDLTWVAQRRGKGVAVQLGLTALAWVDEAMAQLAHEFAAWGALLPPGAPPPPPPPPPGMWPWRITVPQGVRLGQRIPVRVGADAEIMVAVSAVEGASMLF